MLDGRVLGASQVEYKPFGKPPLKREPGSCWAAQRPRLMERQCKRVISQQPRKLLYSVPAALCDEIARAATEELAERLSIPD